MSEKNKQVEKNNKQQLSRRQFLKDASLVVGGAALGSVAILGACAKEKTTTATTTATTTVTSTQPAVPLSKGYLVFDHKKCASCYTCMIACSTAHEGVANPSHARLQIIDDPFGSFPKDITMSICQQCETPRCYLSCPLKDKAFCIDPNTGVRYINEAECIGCGMCAKACYFDPTRIGFNAAKSVATKCDQCRSSTYFSETGKQACVQACPVQAIQFTTVKPIGNVGYEVNLRGEGWAELGLPTD